jgi:hypothetical protein
MRECCKNQGIPLLAAFRIDSQTVDFYECYVPDEEMCKFFSILNRLG